MAKYIAEAAKLRGGSQENDPSKWLVALDLDGTVLTNDHNVPDAVAEAIAATRSTGVRVVIVSARAPVAVRHVLQAIGSIDAIICMGGAQVLRFDGSVWAVEPDLPAMSMTEDEVAEVVTLARGLGLSIAAYSGEHVFADHFDELLMEELRISGMTGEEADLLKLATPVQKFLAIGRSENSPELLKLRMNLGQGVVGVMSNPRYLEVTSANVSKGRALAGLRELWQVPRANCIAIGDSENDLSMFAEVDQSIAMGNALPEVHAAAQYLTASNDEAGVAIALNHFRANFWS